MAEYTYLDSTGVIIPDTADTLTTVEGEFTEALGQELNVDPATPQGRLIATEVTARDTFLRNNADLANQINPRVAGGTFLDAIWALTGGARRGPERTLVQGVALGGIPTTFIPPGTQVVTTDGDPFELMTGVTIPASGTINGDFRSVNFGPVAAAAGSFRFDPLYQVLGWETVNNPTGGILGRNSESDVASRLRRNNTLALQGNGLPEAIISRLYDTDGVRSLSFRENVGDDPATIDGVLMGGHSIFVCVDGGSDLDIANVILEVKGGGCGYNGGALPVVVAVVEPSSGQTYNVTFGRPTEVNLQIEVTARAASGITDPPTVIRNAIIDYAAGEIEGEAGFVVGSNGSPFEIGGAINEESPGIFVRKVRMCVVGGVLGTDEVPINIQQVARINVNNIAVIIA